MTVLLMHCCCCCCGGGGVSPPRWTVLEGVVWLVAAYQSTRLSQRSPPRSTTTTSITTNTTATTTATSISNSTSNTTTAMDHTNGCCILLRVVYRQRHGQEEQFMKKPSDNLTKSTNTQQRNKRQQPNYSNQT